MIACFGRIAHVLSEGATVATRSIARVQWPAGTLILAIQREDELLFPDGVTTLRVGDRVNPDRVNPDRVNPDRVNPDRVNPDRVNPDRVNPGGVNPLQATPASSDDEQLMQLI
jgi:hypothetical protein